MIGDQDTFLDEVLNSLIIQRDLPVTCEMFEMGFDDRDTLFHDRFHHGSFVIWYCLAFNNRDRSFRAGSYTGSETITEEIAYETCFTIDKLKRSLRAVRDTLTASRAFGIVNTDYLPFHEIAPFLFFDSIRLQHTHLTVLFTAGDVVNLPFQRPVLNATDYVHNLQSAFRQRILRFDRERGCVNVPGEKPFIFEFFQPLRENFWGNTIQGIPKLGKPAGISFTFVQLKDDQQCPFLCQVFHRLVDRACILHGMYLETPDYL
jgi:hypothetical protein